MSRNAATTRLGLLAVAVGLGLAAGVYLATNMADSEEPDGAGDVFLIEGRDREDVVRELSKETGFMVHIPDGELAGGYRVVDAYVAEPPPAESGSGVRFVHIVLKQRDGPALLLDQFNSGVTVPSNVAMLHEDEGVIAWKVETGAATAYTATTGALAFNLQDIAPSSLSDEDALAILLAFVEAGG